MSDLIQKIQRLLGEIRGLKADLVIGLGALIVDCGLWLIWPPAAIIFFGAFVVLVGIGMVLTAGEE